MALEISTTEIDGKCLIKVNGEIDLYSSPELRTALTKAVPNARNGVGIDLSEVAYMDSSGVATLVEGLRAASQSNRAFVLVAPSGPVMKVLQLSRLDTVFLDHKAAVQITLPEVISYLYPIREQLKKHSVCREDDGIAPFQGNLACQGCDHIVCGETSFRREPDPVVVTGAMSSNNWQRRSANVVPVNRPSKAPGKPATGIGGRN